MSGGTLDENKKTEKDASSQTVTGRRSITLGSKTYNHPQEAADEKDPSQIELIKEALLEKDTPFNVWMSDHYGSYFKSAEGLNKLDSSDLFFLLGKFSFLSYKELTPNWQEHAVDDLISLIRFNPERIDLFQSYVSQSLPLKGRSPSIDTNPTAINYLVKFFNDITDSGAGCDLLRFLCKNGADVNERSGDNSLPLINAVHNRNIPAVKTLLELGADPNLAEEYAPIFWALSENNDIDKENSAVEIVKLLVKHNAKVNITRNGQTPLLIAAQMSSPKKIELISCLVKHGAKKDYADSNGETAYVYARKKKNDEAAVILNPNAELSAKSFLLFIEKTALSFLTALWIFLSVDILAKAVSSFNFEKTAQIIISIILAHLLTAYIGIIILGVKKYLLKLKGTFNFVSSAMFYVVCVPFLFTFLTALVQALFKMLPSAARAFITAPVNVMMIPSSGAVLLLLYILSLALITACSFLLHRTITKHEKIMEIHREYS
ncbi:MAG: ankyrin repeat domain-containing protein [Treponema sp.]|nr:ankyrin repeat domain-containing protein [Treponema sp.]